MHDSRLKIQDSDPTSDIRGGFTLVELLVVVAVTMTAAVLFLGPFKSMRDRGLLTSSAEQVIGALEQARALTLAGKGSLVRGIHFGTSTVTIFPGPAYVPGNSSNTVIELGPLVVVTSTTSPDIMFQKGTGKTDRNYLVSVSLSADATQQRTITLYATGAIKTQ